MSAGPYPLVVGWLRNRFDEATAKQPVRGESRGLLARLSLGIRVVPLVAALIVFFSYGLLWTMRKRRPRDMKELYELFYVGFLRLKPEHVEVVRLTEDELVTVSRNPCPILRLSLALGVDTRISCKLVSETVCRFVLRRMDPALVFWRDYDHVRPYSDGCLEVIRRARQAREAEVRDLARDAPRGH